MYGIAGHAMVLVESKEFEKGPQSANKYNTCYCVRAIIDAGFSTTATKPQLAGGRRILSFCSQLDQQTCRIQCNRTPTLISLEPAALHFLSLITLLVTMTTVARSLPSVVKLTTHASTAVEAT